MRSERILDSETRAMKSRKLTAREASIRRHYTRLIKRNRSGGLPEWNVEIAIDCKFFRLSPWFEDRPTAAWTRDMLAIALAKIK